MSLNGIRTQIDRIENEVNTQGNLISQIATALQNKAAGSGGIDTSDATASDGDILKGKTAYAKGEKITGTMANNGSINGSIDGLNTTSYTIPTGYTSGGNVSLTNAIQTELSGVIDGSTIKTQVNNINTEVVEQASLISQIVTALEGKAVGGGSGGGSVETCTVTVTDWGVGSSAWYTTLENGVMTCRLFGNYGHPESYTLEVVKGTAFLISDTNDYLGGIVPTYDNGIMYIDTTYIRHGYCFMANESGNIKFEP